MDLSNLRIPPFAQMYGQRRTCHGRLLLTPRNAAHLWVAAIRLQERLEFDLECEPDEDLTWGGAFTWLPMLAWTHDHDWRGWFSDAVGSLADDLASGRCPIPRCTAEEVALNLVLEMAAGAVDAEVIEGSDVVCAGLPVRDDDGLWGPLTSVLFPDPHVLELLRNDFAGLDTVEDLIGRTGMARLAPQRWFVPISGIAPRPTDLCGTRP